MILWNSKPYNKEVPPPEEIGNAMYCGAPQMLLVDDMQRIENGLEAPSTNVFDDVVEPMSFQQSMLVDLTIQITQAKKAHLT